MWLGCADPADTRAAILGREFKRNDLLEVMDLWAASIGTAKFVEVADINLMADASADTERKGIVALRDKLVEICCRSGKWSGTNVGRWLDKHKDRVVGEWSFVSREGGGRGVLSWRLVSRTTDGQSRLPNT